MKYIELIASIITFLALMLSITYILSIYGEPQAVWLMEMLGII